MNEQRQHLEALRQTHQRRLHELEKQAAVFGLSAPPHILLEAEDIRLQIAEIEKQIGHIKGQILPTPVADFAGRENEITQLVNVLNQSIDYGKAATISGVRGMGGIGKTELALAVAQRLVTSFSDGQVVINLRGATINPLEPALAIQAVIRSLIISPILPDDIDQLQTVYQATLAGKRVFILADDAKDAMQVRPLLPPKGCALLITSRQRFTLPGMTVIDLETLPPDKAHDLLLTICPRIDIHAPQLAKLCGYLPLALRVSASLLANDDTRNIERYMDRLTDEQTRLAELRDPDDPSLNVEASIQLSYDTLDTPAQKALSQLSIIPKGFDLATATAIVESHRDVRTEDLLGLLRRRCLLDWDEATGYYSLHDLIRAFALTRLSIPVSGYRYPVAPEIENQAALLAAQRRRLAYRAEQQARLGDDVPPEVAFDINDAQASIQDLKSSLRSAGITVIDDPIDSVRVVKKPEISFMVSRTLKSRELQDRNIMLRKVGLFWVKGVLEKSLFSGALVDLGLRILPHDLVISPQTLLNQDNQRQTPSRNHSIIDIFDENNGSLLILGDPGSGKTTLLLQLARDLSTRAEQDMNYPIPVVFNLSSWINRHISLEDWLVEELLSKYQVPRRLGQAWIDNDQILPLLDGLDEIKPEGLISCIQAINHFTAKRKLVRIALCSRVSEYTSSETRLNLSGTVWIQPLTNHQVNSFLEVAGEGFNGLRTLIGQDSGLQNLVWSPLMLNLFLLAYGEMSNETLSSHNTSEKFQKGLFKAYVNKMLSQTLKTDNSYSREQIVFGLAWIARFMIGNHMTLFRLEDIPLTNRFAASISGTLPWNTIRFLDYCVDLLLLRKVDMGYIFLHRLLLEYFAGLDAEPQSNEVRT